MSEEKKGLWGRLVSGLSKTRDNIVSGIDSIFHGFSNIDDDFFVIQNIANNKRRMDAVSEFIKEKQAITYIKLDDLFKQCNFEREGWVK